jgi:hypothetical protein
VTPDPTDPENDPTPTWDVTITLSDGETIRLQDVSDDATRELEALPFTSENGHVAIVQATSTDFPDAG